MSNNYLSFTFRKSDGEVRGFTVYGNKVISVEPDQIVYEYIDYNFETQTVTLDSDFLNKTFGLDFDRGDIFHISCNGSTEYNSKNEKETTEPPVEPTDPDEPEEGETEGEDTGAEGEV